jgi:predicted DNA-binding transcriptional regulator YafY
MRADRLISIMMLLQARGQMTTAALADALDVSRRTVLRDIAALSASGVPVYASGGHGGGVALDESYRTTLTGLREDEVRALFVSSGAGLLQQLGLGEAGTTMRRKLEGALPRRHQGALEQMRQRVYIDALWWWHEAEMPPFWRDLQDAVDDDRVIRFQYENFEGQVAPREVEAYSLVSKSGAWYLIGRRDDAFKAYRVARIQQLTVLATRFARDPAFDLAAHWNASLDAFRREFEMYAFTLSVDPSRTAYLRYMLPNRAEARGADPDTGWLTYACAVSSREQAMMIVFGLGDDAAIIAPDELRTALRDACARMADRLA